MSVYDVDFPTKAQSDLPPDKRQPTRVAWVQALISELALDAYNLFTIYKQGSTDMQYTAGTYQRRERVRFGNAVFESLIDGNTDMPVTANWRRLQVSFIGSDTRRDFTCNKIVLEYALNLWFGTTFNQPPTLSDIYIETNDLPITVFRVGTVEEISSSVYTDSSSESVVNDYSFTVAYNFTIYIPSAVYAALGSGAEDVVRDFADKYVAAGITYNITTY
jgi:hypothetical protein